MARGRYVPIVEEKTFLNLNEYSCPCIGAREHSEEAKRVRKASANEILSGRVFATRDSEYRLERCMQLQTYSARVVLRLQTADVLISCSVMSAD